MHCQFTTSLYRWLPGTAGAPGTAGVPPALRIAGILPAELSRGAIHRARVLCLLTSFARIANRNEDSMFSHRPVKFRTVVSRDPVQD